MGMHWGNMCRNIRGIYIYSLSPYEQKAFHNVLLKGVPNMVRRIRGQIFRVLPPFIIGYVIYAWAIEEHQRLQRKSPRDRCVE
ncbi:unnamed protein product [Candidula unifasciata]|uniref:Cytochrome b-c1 complex subunit 8 n=1 Tax=Candidula unifasciata TaxID=100452 RepID=A0A8S3ZRV4_9EUPU|nr:unnamed protein product [Candidula unifasciata]